MPKASHELEERDMSHDAPSAPVWPGTLGQGGGRADGET